jgi:hypothetical protein
MVRTFFQMWAETRRGQFPRAIAGVCVVLWLVGSVSTLYGSLTPQWTTPHCPQPHSTGTHHNTHGSCAWHCDSIDNPSLSGRSWKPSVTQTELLSWYLGATANDALITGGVTGRGPPRSSLSAIASAI